MRDRALIDGCFHAFCRSCILSWLALAPSCPLCKAPARRLIHDIRSEKVFRTTRIPSPQPQPQQPQPRHAGLGRQRRPPRRSSGGRAAPVPASDVPCEEISSVSVPDRVCRRWHHSQA